jgi:hypothetical protein
MSELLIHLGKTLISTTLDVLPIITIIIGFQLFVLLESINHLKTVLMGFFYVLLGLALFLVGLDDALFPLGKVMAQQLTDPVFLFGSLENIPAAIRWDDYFWVYLFAAAIGFSTTIAEPALLAVAIKANSVSGGAISIWGLRIAVAVGAATGIALGSFRIITGTPLHYYIIAAYIVVIIQTMMAPRMIIALAYDSGGVTTSTVTVPLVTALGLGLASTIPGRSALLDGFGMIALTCLFPIITLMGYAQLGQWRAKRNHAKEARHVSEK